MDKIEKNWQKMIKELFKMSQKEYSTSIENPHWSLIETAKENCQFNLKNDPKNCTKTAPRVDDAMSAFQFFKKVERKALCKGGEKWYGKKLTNRTLGNKVEFYLVFEASSD